MKVRSGGSQSCFKQRKVELDPPAAEAVTVERIHYCLPKAGRSGTRPEAGQEQERADSSPQ